MDLKRIVRIIVIAQLIIGTVALVIDLKSIPNLPPNLQSYLLDVMNPNIDIAYHNWFSFFIPPIIFVASIIGNIGVFFFKPWARTVYLWTSIISPLIDILLGVIIIEIPIVSIMNQYILISSGLVIGLLYFKQNFYEENRNVFLGFKKVKNRNYSWKDYRI